MTRLPEIDAVPGIDLQEAPAAGSGSYRPVADVVLNKRKGWPLNSPFSSVHVYCWEGI